MPSQWYVLLSKPGKEPALYSYICSENVDCYYPCIQVNPVNPRSRKTKPYFPGYLFVQVNLEEEGKNRFRWTPYSLGLVRFGDEPAVVSENLVFGIQRRLAKINAAGGEEHHGLKPGDRVLIEKGPFQGYSGIFDTRLSGRDRIRVLLTMLQGSREVPVELKIGQISRQLVNA